MQSFPFGQFLQPQHPMGHSMGFCVMPAFGSTDLLLKCLHEANSALRAHTYDQAFSTAASAPSQLFYAHPPIGLAHHPLQVDPVNMMNLLLDSGGKSAQQHFAKSLFARKNPHMWHLSPSHWYGPQNFASFSILFALIGQPVASTFIQVHCSIPSNLIMHPAMLQQAWMKQFLIPEVASKDAQYYMRSRMDMFNWRGPT